MEPAPFLVPRIATLVRHAAPRVIEGGIIPAAVFLIALHSFGIIGAVLAGLGYAYAVIGWRLATRRRVPGILLLGALTVTVRSALALATGSAFVYFLQPSLGTLIVAGAFLVSAGAGRPLAGRLARDFCPIPEHVASADAMHRFFTQITLLWAATELAIAGIAVWLLLSQSVGVFVVTRTVTSFSLTGIAIGLSVLWCRRSMGDRIVFGRHPVATVPRP